MELLRILTLAYAAVLVLALAVSLITIWIYLRKVSAALGDARAALVEVQRESGALQEHLPPLDGFTRESADEIETASAWLEEADRRLATLLDRMGLGSIAR